LHRLVALCDNGLVADLSMSDINKIIDALSSADAEGARGGRDNVWGQKGRSAIPACFLAALLLVLTIPLLLAAEEARPLRGIFPECQMNCLSAHDKKMKLLAEKYQRREDRTSFQDEADSVIREYIACINDCKVIVPVK